MSITVVDSIHGGNIKSKQGVKDEYRIRVGDYRVRYEVDDSRQIIEILIEILQCKHRKDVYRK